MRALLDTNVLVRHVTGVPPGQAQRATALLASHHDLLLTDIVVAEFIYVLDSVYQLPRSQIAAAARSLMALASVAVTDLDLLLRALHFYEEVRLDFAEAYLVALAELSGIGAVATFDRRVGRATSVTRLEP